MDKRILLLTSVLFGLLSTLVTAIPVWGEVAFTRYKYGAYNNGFGCCYSIYGQDYDCQGSRITQYTGRSCYDTGSGDWIYGTCGGGCVGATCSGVATNFCVGVNPNIPCTLHCSVFLDLLGDTGPANCTQQQDQYCSNPVPFDAAADLDGGYLCDKRTPQMIASGCRCLSIGNFSPVSLNLSTGQAAKFTGNISAAGSSLSWAIDVKEGQTIRRTINGSGSPTSYLWLWDGKDDSGKEVSAGDYTATLNVSAAGGWCGDTDTSTKNISVTATPASGACSAVKNFGLNPSLEGRCGSTVNFASGNLSHSQPLFTLPNSKFMGEFNLSYNSLSSQNDVLGTGWTHTYNVRLALNNNGSYTLIEGDGRKTVLYNKGSYYSPQNWNYPALTVNGNGTFSLQHKNGITYTFDTEKKITAISDRNSNTITFTYTGSNLTSVTDPNGRTVTFTYSNNKIYTISDPSGNVHTLSYSGQDLTGVSSQISGVTGQSNWAYTYYANSFMQSKIDPLNKTTWYSYYDDHKLQQTTDPEGKNRSLVYSPAQSLTLFTEKDGGVWQYKYDTTLGVLTEVDYPSPYGTKEKYGYFQSGVNTGKLQYIEDERGKRTYYDYDSNGNGNIASVTDALSHVTSYPIYNSLNQVKRIEYPGSPTPVVLLDYNAQGNLTYVKDPEGNETQFGYDSSGNLTAIQSLGNNLINVTNTYDQYNYLRTMTDNRTGAIVHLEYDSAGNLAVHKDPMTPTNETTFAYNGFNRIRTATDPLGNIIYYYYDLIGNLTSMTDANQKTTSYEYNYRGQLTKITDALNNITQFAYGSGCPSCQTGVEKLTSVTDARGKTTTFQYDLAGRLFKEIDHLGQFRTYTYYMDASQNRITRTDEDNVTIQYIYDDLNRLIQISYPDSTTTTFGYDVRSNVISAANPNIGYTLAYDLNNRLSSLLDSNNNNISYQYNGLNQRTQMITPDGRTITYGYDTGNRLSQITAPIGLFNISYDLAGRRTTLSYPNGVTTTYSYNGANFLTNLLARNSQLITVNSFTYTPDGMSNRTNMTDLAGQHVYTYDDTYQLTNAMHPNMPAEQFTYDQVGNRLTSAEPTPSPSSTEYVYDFENRLLEVNYTGMVAQYTYDPFGRRIQKNVNGTVTRYVYDGPNIVTQYDGTWNVTAQYTHTLRIDDPLTVQQGANTYYYHKDGLGSVVNLSDSAENSIKSYTYKTFGEIYSETGSLVQPFTFTGREYDPESGLYYYRARYYDSRAGRFLTKDPIGFAGKDVNLYRYVRNNPINRIDPWGLYDEIEVHLIVTYQRALAQGIDPNTAWIIATANRDVDISIWTRPESPLALFTGELWYNHFHPRDKWLEKRLRRSCESRDPKAFGRNLHPFEDSFPHLEVNSKSKLYSVIAPIYHLTEMDVDLYFANTYRDQKMIEGIDYWLGEFKKSYYGYEKR